MHCKLLILFIFFTISCLFGQNTNDNREKFLYNLFETTNIEQLKIYCKQNDLSDKGTKVELRQRLYDYFKIKPEKKTVTEIESKRKTIILEQADEAEYLKISQNEEIIKVSGNVKLIYENKKLTADTMKINVKSRDLLCSGNVVLLEGGQQLKGDKLLYNLDTEQGILYHGKSLIGDYVYTGDVIKKIGKDKYSLTDATFSTCDLDEPHFHIEAKKVWIYPDNTIIVLHTFYVLGDVRLFYLPFYFRTKKSTGIITYWGLKKTEGWFMQNTYKYNLSDTTYGNIKFDHYQRRGEYLGLDFRNVTSANDTTLSASGASSKELVGSQNIVDPATGKVKRKERWKAKWNQKYTFNKSKEEPGSATTIQWNLFRMSDRYFLEDFENYRVMKPGFSYKDITSTGFGGDWFSQQSQDWSFILSDNRAHSSLSVKAIMNFQWNDSQNKYIRSTATFPEIYYGMYGSLWPSKGTNGFYPDIRYNSSILFSDRTYYDIQGSYNKKVTSRNLNFALSRQFGIANIFQYMPSVGVGNNEIWGKDITEAEARNYENMSYSFVNYNENLRLGPSFFYLDLKHSIEWKLKEPLPGDEYGYITSHRLNASLAISALRSSLSASSGVNLRTKRNERLKLTPDRYDNLNINFNTAPVSGLNYNEWYSHSIRYSQPTANVMNLSYNSSFMNTSLYWNHDFGNPRASRFNFTFGFSRKLAKYWNLEFSSTSKNEKLYLYSKSLYKKYKPIEGTYDYRDYEYRNFFEDLLNSINIFNPEKRKHSYFKWQSANLVLTHNLHCWQLVFGYTLSQRYQYLPGYQRYPYFESTVYVKINLIAEPELKFEKTVVSEPPTVK